MNTIICKDPYELAVRCAEEFRKLITAKPDALICLPAGSSSVDTYRVLAELHRKGEIDFSHARFVALDEWLDLEDESENCNAFMWRNFYGPLNIRTEQLVTFDIHAADMEKECKRIDDYIFSCSGIDLMLLGIGRNGHLGLNEQIGRAHV